MKKKVLLLMIIVSLIGGFVFAAGEQEKKQDAYPSKTITIINPYGAGGGTDILIRKIANLAEKDLGQSIVVVNKTGGSGAIGSAVAQSSKPDGYTFLANDKALLSSYHMGVGQTKWTDLETVCRIAIANYAIVTSSDSGFNTIAELVNEAKANPNTLTIGVSGIGGMSHLVSETFISESGAQIKVVGFDGGSDTKAALAGNQITCASLQLGEIMPLVESGHLKILGVVQDTRNSSKKLQNVPTLKEQGVDCTLDQYWTLWAPKGTSSEHVNIIAKAFEKAIGTDEFRVFMEENYYTGAWLNPSDSVKALEKEDAFLKNLIKSAGLSK